MKNELRIKNGVSKRFRNSALCIVNFAFALAAAKTHAGFTFDAAQYVEGEALAARGAAGASWAFAEGSEKPTGDGEGRVCFNDGADFSFIANASPADGETSAVYEYEFTFDSFMTEAPLEPADSLAGMCPAQFDGLSTGFYVQGDGRWIAVEGDGVAIAVGTPVACRIMLREVAGVRFVSYAVRGPGGYVQLTTREGRREFRAGETASAVRISRFNGTGSLSRIDGAERVPETTPRAIYWVGGESGDWSDGANWALTDGGNSANEAPQSGDVAFVPGEVELTVGGKTAKVRDLVVEAGEGGGEMIGGGICPVLSVDLSRPRIGKALSVESSEGVFGVTPFVRYAWTRGSATKAWDASPFSSDASFTPQAEDLGHWFRVTAGADDGLTLDRTFYFSRFPVLYMTTDDGLTPTAEKEDHEGKVYVQGNAEWKSLYDGKMYIKVRGNTTKYYPKKPWKLKLDKKTDMFGFGKSKHWVLLANYNDMSQMRGRLAADFANDTGSLGMDSTWVECVLNGELQGLYQFMEHVRVDANRVDIYDWEDNAKKFGSTEEDFSGLDAMIEAGAPVDISGGYLFEFSQEYDDISKFTTKSGNLEMLTMFSRPEYACTSTNMMNWCGSYMQDFWDAVTSADRKNAKGKYYTEYADMDSMVAYTLVCELFANNDATKKSRYAYIDRGGKLFFGPVWDFDWGCASIRVGQNPEYWACSKDNEGDNSRKYSFQKELASDVNFCRRLYARYWEVRERYEEVFKAGGLIDQYAAVLAEASAVDDNLWWGRRSSGEKRTAADDRAILKTFLAARAQWLDAQFASVETLMASLKCAIQTNPAGDEEIAAQADWSPEAVREAETLADGTVIPEMKLEWIRVQLEPADAGFGWATDRQLKDAAVMVPTAWGKPTPLWQDYVAGTRPDAVDDLFHVTDFSVAPDGTVDISYSPDLGEKRSYTVLGCENLGDAWHEKSDGDRFFKVQVSMPSDQ